jgi:hypothetical protein
MQIYPSKIHLLKYRFEEALNMIPDRSSNPLLDITAVEQLDLIRRIAEAEVYHRQACQHRLQLEHLFEWQAVAIPGYSLAVTPAAAPTNLCSSWVGRRRSKDSETTVA